MSRSHRKTPKITGGRKDDKREASKAVRNYLGYIQEGKNYKKIFCSWNIRDYRPRCWDKNDEQFYLLKRK